MDIRFYFKLCVDLNIKAMYTIFFFLSKDNHNRLSTNSYFFNVTVLVKFITAFDWRI